MVLLFAWMYSRRSAKRGGRHPRGALPHVAQPTHTVWTGDKLPGTGKGIFLFSVSRPHIPVALNCVHSLLCALPRYSAATLQAGICKAAALQHLQL